MGKLMLLDIAAMALGADDGIIRADEFAHLDGLERAFEDMRAREQMGLEDGEARAAQLLDDARREATQMMDAAEAAIREQSQRGYDEGVLRAAKEWHARQTDHTLRLANSLQMAQTELVDLVVSCVSRLVLEGDRTAFFEQALVSIQSYIREQTTLRLRVHPDDAKTARAATSAWSASARSPVTIEVQADGRLQAGSSIFESEFGVFDASLNVQLAAIREAMLRAAGGADAPALAARVTHTSEPAPPEDAPAGAHVDASTAADNTDAGALPAHDPPDEVIRTREDDDTSEELQAVADA